MIIRLTVRIRLSPGYGKVYMPPLAAGSRLWRSQPDEGGGSASHGRNRPDEAVEREPKAPLDEVRNTLFARTVHSNLCFTSAREVRIKASA